MKHGHLLGFLLCVIVLTGVLHSPAMAAIETAQDYYFSNFTINASSYKVLNEAAAKGNTTPMYLYITSASHQSIIVMALGCGVNVPSVNNTTNCTCDGDGYQTSYVTCNRYIDYSVHSSVWEDGYPFASFGFTNNLNAQKSITGEWSADTIYSHVDAY